MITLGTEILKKEDWVGKGLVRRHAADSLIGRACQGSPGAFYGVQAAIQPLHTLVNCPELTHANALQLQELTLIS